MAALALREFEAFDTKATQKKNLKEAIERVSSRLGNTPSICRKCYIHPEVLSAYVEGNLLLEIKDKVEEELRENIAELKPEEAAVLAMLEQRLQRTLEGSLKESLAAVTKKKKPRPRKTSS
jgi:DNA topoisomerase-1